MSTGHGSAVQEWGLRVPESAGYRVGMDATSRFTEVVGVPEAAIPLDEAALLVAAHARPDLDVATEQARLDRLAAGVAAPTLDAMRAYLFSELHFSGDHDDYYDPRNSYLDQVVARRRGIPLTLSLLLLEVGRRIGVPLAGVAMPGHFLVRDKVDPEVFVDAFEGGALLDRAACRRRFHELRGPEAPFDPSYLEPVGKRAMVARMLANLDAIASARGDRMMLEWVVRLEASLPGAPASQHRRLAVVLAASARFGEAAEVLERLADADPVAASADDAATARRLRARLN